MTSVESTPTPKLQPEVGPEPGLQEQIAAIQSQLPGVYRAEFRHDIDTFNSARRRHIRLGMELATGLMSPDYGFDPKKDDDYQEFTRNLTTIGRTEVALGVNLALAQLVEDHGLAAEPETNPSADIGHQRAEKLEIERNKKALELLTLALTGAGDEYRDVVRGVAVQKTLNALKSSTILSAKQKSAIEHLSVQPYDRNLPERLADLSQAINRASGKKIGKKMLGRLGINGNNSTHEPSLEDAMKSFKRFTKAFNMRLNPGSLPHAHPAEAEIKRYLAAEGLMPEQVRRERLYDEMLNAAATAYEPDAINTYLMKVANTQVLPLLAAMGLVREQRSAPEPGESTPQSEEARIMGYKVGVKAYIDGRIAELKASGLPEKEVFWQLAKEWHPDQNPDPEAHESMTYINQRLSSKR